MVNIDDRAKAQPNNKKRFTLSPSQFWILNDCERCFAREVVYGVRRPSRPPEIYNLADCAMKRRFDLGPEVVHNLGIGPSFQIIAQGLHVESIPYVDESDVEIVLKGRLDALVRTADGSIIVVDYKTMTRTDVESGARAYSPQLHSYALALRYPKMPQQKTQIDGLALLVYHPAAFTYKTERQVSGLYGVSNWVEVPMSDKKFRELLHDTSLLLIGERQPKPNPKCGYCTYYGAVPMAISPTGSEAVL